MPTIEPELHSIPELLEAIRHFYGIRIRCKDRGKRALLASHLQEICKRFGLRVEVRRGLMVFEPCELIYSAIVGLQYKNHVLFEVIENLKKSPTHYLDAVKGSSQRRQHIAHLSKCLKLNSF